MSSNIDPMGFSLPANFDLNALFKGSAGPVNWDVAAFVSAAMAGDAEASPRWHDVEDEYTQLVRAAEVMVTSYTKLTSPELLTPVQVVSRARWAELHLKAFAPLVEPMAKKLANIDPAQVHEGTTEVPFQNLLKALMPFIMGSQTGMLVGFLSHHVLGRYDLMLPPASHGSLVFVAENLETAERSLNVVPRDFKFWLALHEVIRAIVYSQPGIRESYAELVDQLAETVQFDFSRISDMPEIDMNNMSSMQSMLEGAGDLMATEPTAQQQAAAQKMHDFIGLIEGFSDHVMSAVAGDSIPSIQQIETAIAQQRSERSDVEDVFEQMMGFDLRRREFQDARRFCDKIVADEGIDALNRVWAQPVARPNQHEFEHPQEWVARTIGRRG